MSGLELNVKSSRDDSYSSQIASSPESMRATKFREDKVKKGKTNTSFLRKVRQN